MSTKIKLSNVKPNLTTWLQQYKTEKGQEYTHTSMGYPAGSYYIPFEEKKKLIELINCAVFIEGKSVSLTEKVQQHTIIKADLDFKQNDKERKFNIVDIQNIIKLYQQAITHYLDIDPSVLVAHIFTREKPYHAGSFYKDGIHIMFPDIICDTDIQHLIRDHVIKNIGSTFDKLQFINDVKDIIDKSVISTNNWLMYGCSKPGLQPYLCSYIFDSELNECVVDDEHNDCKTVNMQLINQYSIRDHDIALSIPIKEELQKELIKPNRLKIKVNTKIIQENKNESHIQFHSSMKQEFSEVLSLVEILSHERSDKYKTWIKVGWCLHNIDFKSKILLDCWIDFSKKSPKFKSGECEEKWSQMKVDPNGLKIGSLHRWAKQDNPEEYKKIVKKGLNELLNKSLSGSTQSIAKVLHYLYKDEFVCSCTKTNSWYRFQNHKWRKDGNASKLRLLIRGDLLQKYEDLNVYFENIMKETNDKSLKETYENKIQSIGRVISKIEDISFKEKLVRECADYFYDESFLEKLDYKTHLIGFENGVYDLGMGLFRDGEPDDYVTLTTGYDYKPYSDDDPIASEILVFLGQLFQEFNENDERIFDLQNYMTLLMSSFLDGKNPDEHFNIWTGKGGNGKSKLVSLLKYTFGKYAKEIPVQIFTKERISHGAADPCIAALKGIRLCTTGEPDDIKGKGSINMAVVKMWTGGDDISCRGLYQEQTEFKPQFKIVFCCNQIPNLTGENDCDGKWRRVKVVPFNSKFTTKPDPDNKFQFKADGYLDQKFPSWRQTFMGILIENYKIYKLKGLPQISAIADATESYKNNMDDSIQEFIDSTFEKKEGYFLTFTDIWDVYKNSGKYFEFKQRTVFKDKMLNKMGGPKSKPWLDGKYFANTSTPYPSNNKGNSYRSTNGSVYVDWRLIPEVSSDETRNTDAPQK